MKPSLPSESGRLHKIGALTLTVLALWPASMTQAADISWTGGTASYTNAANWGGTVPGPGDTAINDNGTNNVVQINSGNPDWTLGRLRAGNGTGSGAFEQNGQTVTVNAAPRPFRMGVAPGFTGVYTLNSGTLIFTNGDFVVGQLGTGILNVNGGTISGSANFAVNIGTSIDAVNATMDGGTNRTGFTWFEQGLYTTDPTRGLPPAGSTFASISDATHSYTMPSSYAGTGSLMLNAGVPNGAITLTSPTACSGLSFLGSAGNGPVNVSYTVHHADSTIETGNISVLDWFATNAPAWSAGGRVPANGLGFQIISAPNNPNLYSLDIVLTNTTSAVTSINLTYGSGGVACLFALSGSSGGNFNPLAISGYNADMVLDLATPIYVSNTVTSILNQVAGVITNTGEFWVGNYGTGIYNLSGGTNSIANWIAIGRSGGNGTLNMTGGVLNKSGNGNLLVGTGFQAPIGSAPVGVFNHSAGTINCLNQFQIPENSPATGTYNLSGTGVLNANDWLAIGRDGGAGVMNMSGGTITKTGGGQLDIGASGSGILTQTGGVITNTATETWVGETGTGNGTWNLNGGSAIVGVVHIGQNVGAVGTLNLNGGLLRATEVTSGNAGSFSTLDLNGGTLQAAADATAFLHDLTLAFVQAGGAVFDSQGFNISVAQPLLDSGGGGLTKNGTGTVTLTGASTYTGATVVNAGVLNAATASSGGGSYTVASGAGGMGVVVVGSLNSQLNASSVTLPSTATVFNFDLGAFGNPTLAPLNVVGALTVNGTVTVNIADALPQIGQFPLIKYGSIAGSGGFVIGSTPFGVVASISNNVANNSIDLVVTSVNAPRWEGQAGGNWDISVTTNWINLGNNQSTFYTDGSTVIFDDTASGTTTVNLVATVHPQSITINNTNLNYTLTGSGKISGTIGLNKQGTGTFAILNTGGNNYTGPTVVTAGTLSVTNLANGGLPSAIGASSADPTNLVLQPGGTFSYAGPPVSINRGYLVQSSDGTIDTATNLTLSGLVRGGTGTFSKTGSGQLAYTGVGGTNLLTANVAGVNYLIKAGSVLLDGSTNIVRNLNLGFTPGVDTAIVLTNTTLIARTLQLGNNVNCTGTLILNSNSLFTVAANNFAVGISPGLGQPSAGVFIQNPGTTLDSAAELWDGQGLAGVGTYIMNGGVANFHTWVAIGRAGAVGTFNMTGGTVNKDATVGSGTRAFIIGTSAGNNTITSIGTLNQSGGTLNTTSEYWVGENALDFGTNNISGTAVVNWGNWVSIGRRGRGVVTITGGTINRNGGGSAIVVGDNVGGPGNGYVNQSGGTLTSQNELWVGQGNGTVGQYDLSGTGSVTINNWVAIGRGGATGTFNLSGGSLTKTGTGGNHFLIGAGGNGTLNQTGGALTNVLSETRVADGGTGTWNLSGGSAVVGVLHISQNSGTTGTLNLNGGTLAATEVSMFNPAGHSTLNLNGGTLIARNGANANFLHDLSTNNVQAGGAIIDSGTNTINVAQALLDGGGGGGLTKIGNGTLRLNGVNTYTGTTLVNAGTLGGTGIIAGPVSVASGATLAPGASIGTLTINNSLTLSGGSTTFVEVSRDGGLTNNDLVTGLSSVTYGGSLVAMNVGSNALTGGGVFKLFNNSGAVTGNFSSVTVLPTGRGSFNPATGELTIAPIPTFNPPIISGGNLILTGTGEAGAGYTLLTSTNVTLPITSWTTNLTGTFSGSGTFSNAIPRNPSEPKRFYILRTP